MLSNSLFVDLLEAVHATLLPAGYQMLIGVTHYDPAEEEQLLQGYMARRPAGLLLTGFDRTDGSRRLIKSARVPCVHLMETSDTPGVHSVGFSQSAAGYAMTRHLIERGYRRVMFIGAQLDPRTLQRLQGYRDALRGAGLYDPALELLDPHRSSMALGAELLECALREHESADALFFCNDDLAQGGLLAALRLRVPVPQRVAVAGFNDLAGSDQMLPPLTTVHTPRTEIGRQATAMLLQLVRGEAVAQGTIDVGCTLAVRGST
jgi:LacI family gluconate utilization system Gnt-I transcriptional repressor